jgi:Uncharacterized membrane protein required for alginate biosynthesis
MDNNWFSLLKFIAGGSIVAGTTVLAQQISPKYGGILATAPIITTLAFIFMFTGTGAAATRQLVLNSFYFVIPTVLFMLVLYLFMGRYSFYPSLALAFGAWIVALFLIDRLITAGIVAA